MKALVLLALLVPAVARAETLEDTSAFDRAFASSFYVFDACGDAKSGLIFRDALDARFAQCPFSERAREAHRSRSALQARKSRDLIKALIDETGGVPVRLPGMTGTCRERQSEPDYVETRAKLERFALGVLKPEDILPAPCDAEALTP